MKPKSPPRVTSPSTLSATFSFRSAGVGDDFAPIPPDLPAKRRQWLSDIAEAVRTSEGSGDDVRILDIVVRTFEKRICDMEKMSKLPVLAAADENSLRRALERETRRREEAETHLNTLQYKLSQSQHHYNTVGHHGGGHNNSPVVHISPRSRSSRSSVATTVVVGGTAEELSQQVKSLTLQLKRLFNTIRELEAEMEEKKREIKRQSDRAEQTRVLLETKDKELVMVRDEVLSLKRDLDVIGVAHERSEEEHTERTKKEIGVLKTSLGKYKQSTTELSRQLAAKTAELESSTATYENKTQSLQKMLNEALGDGQRRATQAEGVAMEERARYKALRMSFLNFVNFIGEHLSSNTLSNDPTTLMETLKSGVTNQLDSIGESGELSKVCEGFGHIAASIAAALNQVCVLMPYLTWDGGVPQLEPSERRQEYIERLDADTVALQGRAQTVLARVPEDKKERGLPALVKQGVDKCTHLHKICGDVEEGLSAMRTCRMRARPPYLPPKVRIALDKLQGIEKNVLSLDRVAWLQRVVLKDWADTVAACSAKLDRISEALDSATTVDLEVVLGEATPDLEKTPVIGTRPAPAKKLPPLSGRLSLTQQTQSDGFASPTSGRRLSGFGQYCMDSPQTQLGTPPPSMAVPKTGKRKSLVGGGGGGGGGGETRRKSVA
eukprot:PhM_4_TR2363/c0_g1_i1/m.105287